MNNDNSPNNESETVREISEINVRLILIYLIIFTCILYLIIYYKSKAEVVDNVMGTNYKSEYPDVSFYPYVLAIIYIIINSVFLYFSSELMKRHPERFIKYPNAASDPYFVNNLVNIVQLIATFIATYNVFVNRSDRINITR